MRRGFGRDDLFVATHEQFLTETARWSDIVLPATMFMEHDDIYQAGGHSHIQIGPKLIEPPDSCRSNHAVIQGLASRLGAVHRGFDMTAMQLVDATLLASGYPDAKTVSAARWIDEMPSFREAHFLDGFPNKDRRFHFAPNWKALGDNHAVMPKMPDQMDNIEAATPDAPFRLVTRAGAQLSQYQLHRDGVRPAAGRTPDGADASRRRQAPGDNRRMPGTARQCARRGHSSRAHIGRPAAGRAGVGERVAE